MNISAEELKEILRKAWQRGAAAANAGVDEPLLMDTEIEFLIDEVSPMIRRAQAEALLKLAEALEECERNGVDIYYDNGHEVWANGDYWPLRTDTLESAGVRIAIAKLYPKSEEAK